MKLLACLVCAGALATLGCGDDGDGSSAEADADVQTGADADVEAAADAAAAVVGYFEHPLYDDPADCPDDPLFNCKPAVELCADGTAAMLVTDIVNTGTHESEGDTITTEWDSGDVPSEIVFAVSGDGEVLTDDWQDWTWTRAETEFSFCD